MRRFGREKPSISTKRHIPKLGEEEIPRKDLVRMRLKPPQHRHLALAEREGIACIPSHRQLRRIDMPVRNVKIARRFVVPVPADRRGDPCKEDFI